MMRLAVTCFFAASASASVPGVLSFTGTLSNTDGRPVDDASYDVTFRLFDAQNGGTEVWIEPLGIPTKDGVFTALLGAGAVPLGAAVFDGGQRTKPRAGDPQVTNLRSSRSTKRGRVPPRSASRATNVSR